MRAEPRQLIPEDFQRLRERGMHESAIVELVAMAGLPGYANIMADALRVEADAMFATM